MKPVLAWSSAFVFLFGAVASAAAAPLVFFGETLTPLGAVIGAAATARASFLSNLVGVGSEGFESQTPNTSPLVDKVNVQFAGSASAITATLMGGGYGVVNATGDPDTGRFNTTPNGTKWWLAAQPFSIAFNVPVSAFGFYGTDIGDFDGQLTIDLVDKNGQTTRQTVNNKVNGDSGSLLFWGFIDPNITYVSLTFGNTAAGFDGFGFDDMVVGDLGQIKPPTGVPEPVSLALVGTALLGVAATRRRRLAA